MNITNTRQKHAGYSKKYRMKKTLQFEKFKKEEKPRVPEEKRSKAKERQRKCRDKKGLNLLF